MRQTALMEYIRNEYNNPYGVCVAVRVGDEIKYGYSLCNEKADQYDKKLGIQIATNRAMSDHILPESRERKSLIWESYVSLQNRAVKYFKDVEHPDILGVIL